MEKKLICRERSSSVCTLDDYFKRKRPDSEAEEEAFQSSKKTARSPDKTCTPDIENLVDMDVSVLLKKLDEMRADLKKDIRAGNEELRQDFRNYQEEWRKEREEMLQEINGLKETVKQMKTKEQELVVKLDSLENQSRRSNVVFYNIDEKEGESWSECEGAVIKLAKEKMGVPVESRDIERAHRLGKKSKGRHRPIIVKFLSFKTKEEILANSNKLRGSNITVSEDFSARVRAVRKELIQHMEPLKKKGHRVFLRFDMLQVDGRKYSLEQVRGKTNWNKNSQE